MKKYSYLTVEIKPEELDVELEKYGSYGWELCQIMVMQKQIQRSVIGGSQAMQIENKFLIIFKKSVVEIKA